MAMYKCCDCGAEFDVPETIYDSVPYGMGSVLYPSADVCPYCKGNFEEIEVEEIE